MKVGNMSQFIPKWAENMDNPPQKFSAEDIAAGRAITTFHPIKPTETIVKPTETIVGTITLKTVKGKKHGRR